MLMLSPRWQSSRMSEQLLIVNEVPPPPLDDSSCWTSFETATLSVSLTASEAMQVNETYCR